MFQGAMSTNSSTLSEESGLANFNPLLLQNTSIFTTQPQPQLHQTLPKKVKKKRNLPGNPDPDAEVIALSPKSLLATNRFVCEVCSKGFQRDQNLQLHRRGHNLPWKLKQRSNKEVIRKKVYVCPEPNCVHHHPSRALGDLTGIKKHFCRKHGEKKYKCEKCSKIYAVQSDWKAHSKTCGTREYRCDCGTLFSRRDSFITHRAFCDALAEETTRLSTNPFSNPIGLTPPSSLAPPPQPPPPPPPNPFSNLLATSQNPNPNIFPFSSPLAWEDQNPNPNPLLMHIKSETHHFSPPPFFQPPPSHFLSATALLQKAVSVGAVASGAQLLAGPHYQQQQQQPHHQEENQHSHDHDDHFNTMLGLASLATWGKDNEGFTRDFLGLTAGDHYGSNGANDATSTVNGGGGGEEEGGDEIGDMLKFTSGLQYGVTTGYNDTDNSSSLLLKTLHDNHIHRQQQQQQMHDHAHGEHEHGQVEGFGNFVGGGECEPPRLGGGGSDSFGFLAKP